MLPLALERQYHGFIVVDKPIFPSKTSKTGRMELDAVASSTCMEQHNDQRATGRPFPSTVQTSRRPRAYYAFIRWSQLRPLRPRTAARTPRSIIIAPQTRSLTLHHSLVLSRSLSHRFLRALRPLTPSSPFILGTPGGTPSTTPVNRRTTKSLLHHTTPSPLLCSPFFCSSCN
jgi:hypothetical protein